MGSDIVMAVSEKTAVPGPDSGKKLVKQIHGIDSQGFSRKVTNRSFFPDD